MNDPQKKISLSKLIAELCPNGVEFKKLGDVCEITRGVRVTKKDLLPNGKYPVVSGGIGFMGYLDDYNREAETITIAQYGTAGYVRWQQQKFWANDVCFSVIPDEKIILNKYLYYFLANKQEFLYSISNRDAIPYSIDREKILKIKIPVPPMEVQREIVRILDKFTDLSALLETELIARKKQYEYYREKLLTFAADIPRVNICEIFEIRNGYTPSKAKSDFWENGTIPWFVMEDVRKNGRVLSDSIQHVTPEAVKGKGLFKANSIIMATSATIGEHALITVDHLSNQRFINLKIRDAYSDLADIKYLFYYAFVIDEWCKKNTSVSSFATVDMAGFKKLEIPLPPLAEQKRIADILDRFDALCNDLASGIPAEIAARKKQYEYYRDRLLTFREKIS